MKIFLRRFIYFVIGFIILGQFFHPEKTNPLSEPQHSIRKYPGIPPEVLTKFEQACFDCHSNETRWPWYSAVTPVNYLLVRDVANGRRHVNFSAWNIQKTLQLQSWLDKISDEISQRDMPLKEYIFLHPEAKLSDTDIKLICDWVTAEQDRLVDTVNTEKKIK
jgi:hypothetical protein